VVLVVVEVVLVEEVAEVVDLELTEVEYGGCLWCCGDNGGGGSGCGRDEGCGSEVW